MIDKVVETIEKTLQIEHFIFSAAYSSKPLICPLHSGRDL